MTRGTADANGLSLLLLLLSHLRSILLLRSTLRHPVLIATTGTKLVACHRGLVLRAPVRLSLLVLLWVAVLPARAPHHHAASGEQPSCYCYSH